MHFGNEEIKMKAYIQCGKSGMPFNETVFNAYDGFSDMGVETCFFRTEADCASAAPADILVGGLGPLKSHLQRLGCVYPELDYPVELVPYLGRKIWTSTINQISNSPECWPVFVKPVIDKQFIGRKISAIKDLIGCGCCDDDYEVLCSEAVDFRTEWRVFVRYGKVLDVRPYRGDWRLHFDADIISCCVRDYTTIPAACAMDFGVTDDGRTLLVEVNDGFSVGSYGLESIAYAKFLESRWAELTGTEDACDFANECALWVRERNTSCPRQ